MRRNRDYSTHSPIVQSQKQKNFERVLNSKLCEKNKFTETDLEPYWLEFRSMSAKKNVLTIDSLEEMLSTLNVNKIN